MICIFQMVNFTIGGLDPMTVSLICQISREENGARSRDRFDTGEDIYKIGADATHPLHAPSLLSNTTSSPSHSVITGELFGHLEISEHEESTSDHPFSFVFHDFRSVIGLARIHLLGDSAISYYGIACRSADDLYFRPRRHGRRQWYKK